MNKARFIRKLGIAAATLLIVISLATNYILFRVAGNVHINGGSDALFRQYGDHSTLIVDGCLLWQDEDKRPKLLRQYFKLRAITDRREVSCSVVEATQINESVIVQNAEACDLISINTENKSAVVKFKDAVITVNRERAIWATDNPDEKGGGELVSCTHKDLNWYLFE